MPVDVVMPKLGLTMSHGVVSRWLKAAGEPIRAGEPLLEVATDKINYEVESPAAGVLSRIVAAEGEEHACGAVVAVIALGDDAVAAGREATSADRDAMRGGYEPAANGRIVASPAARKLARERGVDLAGVPGSGPRGRVTLADVLAARAPVPAALTTVAHAGHPAPPAGAAHRRALFRKMSEVGSIPIAHLGLTVRVDALRDLMARRGDFGWTAAAVYALGRALRDDPSLRIDAGSGEPFGAIDIGVATDTPHGLIVPVVRGADRLSLAASQAEIVRLSERARAGQLGPADVGGACFSLSNLGPQQIERAVPLVDPPQTAILGMGAATQRPAVVDGALAPAWLIDLGLSFDHRFVDGAPAARFLATVARGLGDPGWLL